MRRKLPPHNGETRVNLSRLWRITPTVLPAQLRTRPLAPFPGRQARRAKDAPLKRQKKIVTVFPGARGRG
jgi:hypothetical protein